MSVQWYYLIAEMPEPKYSRNMSLSRSRGWKTVSLTPVLSSFLKSFALYLSIHYTSFFKGLVKFRQKVAFLGGAFICSFTL